jgi:hypothetical protein
MPRFPKKEADIVALAEWLWRGLFGNHPVYPQPPVHPIWLRIKSMIYLARRNDFIAAKGAAEQATADKDDALEDLIDAMRSDIRYAENTVDYHDDKLKLIGLAGRPQHPGPYPARHGYWKRRIRTKAGSFYIGKIPPAAAGSARIR